MSKKLAPTISNVSVTPPSGPGGTTFSAAVTASGHPPLRTSYQWLLDGKPITGATASSIIATSAGSLRVRVTVTNSQGSDSRDSAAVSVTPSLAPPEVTEISVTPMTGAVGDSFAAIVSTTGVPVPEITYQWLLDGRAVPGATSATYAPLEPGALVVRATAANTEGSDSRDSAAATVTGMASAPAITAVTIAPVAGRVGDPFTAAATAIGEPKPTVTFQWLIDGAAVPGATEPTIRPEATGSLTVRATARNPVGESSRDSAPVSVAPSLVAPRVVAARILPAEGRVGDTFTVTAEAAGEPMPTLAYQWMIDESAVPGATAAAHAPASPGMLSVRVTASSPVGIDELAADAAMVSPALVAPVIAELRVEPASGSVGDTFSAVVAVSGSPQPEVRFVWRLDGVAIDGASGPSIAAPAAGALAVLATAENPAGADSRLSGAAAVAPAVSQPDVTVILAEDAAVRVERLAPLDAVPVSMDGTTILFGTEAV